MQNKPGVGFLKSETFRTLHLWLEMIYCLPNVRGLLPFNSPSIRRRKHKCALRVRVCVRARVYVRFWSFPEKQRRAASRRAASPCQTVDFPLSSSSPYITDPPFSPDTMTRVIYQTRPCQGLCVCVRVHGCVRACVSVCVCEG